MTAKERYSTNDIYVAGLYMYLCSMVNGAMEFCSGDGFDNLVKSHIDSIKNGNEYSDNNLKGYIDDCMEQARRGSDIWKWKRLLEKYKKMYEGK